MNKKIGVLVGTLAVAGVVGFGVYQSSADSNILFQPSESPESEEFEMREREETTEVKEGAVAKATVEQKEEGEKKTSKKVKQEDTASEANISNLTREEVRAKLTAEYPGIVTQFELDREDGRWIYEVEIHGPDLEYELDVDVETGEIVKFEQERDNGKKYKVLSEANLLTMGEVENIALNEFPGTIKEVELDRDDGRLIYEIEIKDGKNEAEFDIEATTGEIMKLEFDYED